MGLNLKIFLGYNTHATSVVDTMIDISFSIATSSIQMGVCSSSFVLENVMVMVSNMGSYMYNLKVMLYVVLITQTIQRSF